MKYTVTLLLLSLIPFCFAQTPPTQWSGQKANPQKTIEELRNRPSAYTQWGALYDKCIPATCTNPRIMKGKNTCRVFVSFAGRVPKREVWDLRFRVWDDTAGSSSDDNLYRVYLDRPSWRGIYIYGVPGHKIMLEVTYR